jgi:hypothetical protein
MTLRTWDEVEELTNELEAFAAWKESMLWKLYSAQRHFEPAHLEAGVREFNRECRSLAKSWGERA